MMIDCDPGHDDAMALLLALASPELELLGVTTVSGNQTLEKTTANAIRVLDLVGGGARRSRPGRTDRSCGSVRGGVRPRRERPGRAYAPAVPAPAVAAHAVDFVAERLVAAPRPVTLIPMGPLTNVALLLAAIPMPRSGWSGSCSWAARSRRGTSRPQPSSTSGPTPRPPPRVRERARRDDDRPRRHASGADDERARRAARAAGRIGTIVAELRTSTSASTARRTAPGLARPRRGRRRARLSVPSSWRRSAARRVDCASELCRGRTVVDLWRRTGRTERPRRRRHRRARPSWSSSSTDSGSAARQALTVGRGRQAGPARGAPEPTIGGREHSSRGLSRAPRLRTGTAPEAAEPGRSPARRSSASRADAPAASVAAAHEAVGAEVVKSFRGRSEPPARPVRPRPASPKRREATQGAPDVLYAQPNYVYARRDAERPALPGDLELHNTGQSGGTPDADIEAPEAWDARHGQRRTSSSA